MKTKPNQTLGVNRYSRVRANRPQTPANPLQSPYLPSLPRRKANASPSKSPELRWGRQASKPYEPQEIKCILCLGPTRRPHRRPQMPDNSDASRVPTPSGACIIFVHEYSGHVTSQDPWFQPLQGPDKQEPRSKE